MPEALKTVASMADLNRLAAATGAVVRVGGRTINAAGESVVLRPPPPAPTPVAPEPVSPPPAGVSAEELHRMLAERDAQWEQRMNSIFSALLMSDNKRPAPPEWDFSVDYGPKGEITGIRARPMQ